MGNTSKAWCLGLTAAILSTIALLFSCLANFWCHNYRYNSARPAVKDLQVGLWYYTGIRQSGNQIFGDKGEDDEELFVNSHKCSAYSPGVNMDGFWMAARVFSIIATILGFIFMIMLWLTPWAYRLRPTSWRTTGITMMIFMPLIQGLTFLFWRSDQCKNRSQLDDVNEEGEEANDVNFLTTYPGSCNWNQGSTLNVVGIILWFLTGLFMALTHPPRRHHKEHIEQTTTTEVHEKHTTVTPGHTMTTGAGTGVIGGAHTAEHRSDTSSNNSHGMHHGVHTAGTGIPVTTLAPTPAVGTSHFGTGEVTAPHFAPASTGTDTAMHHNTVNQTSTERY